MSLFDILLKLFNFIFFLFELSDQIVELFLEKFILLNTVEVVDSHPGDLIGELLNFCLLVGDVVVSGFGLLQQVGGRLLDGFLLRSVVDDVISNFFGFGVKGHDGLLEDVHLFFNISLFDIHSLRFVLGLSDRVLKHHELLVESLSLIFDLELSLLKEILITFHFLELGIQFFRDFLLFLGLISDSRNFRFNLKNIILLLLNELLDSL